VVTIIDGDGALVEIPSGATTPLVLTLAPGDYEVHVARSGASDPPLTCRVTVQDASLAHCRLELARVKSADYFKESGWWR
jgi:hypothetical protein